MLSGKVEGMAEPTSQNPNLNDVRQHIDPIAESISIMARLRALDGCPWDREQTFDSIKKHTLEETYEVLLLFHRRGSRQSER
jgi:nucleoside triphosphate diphosphatase